MVCDSLMEFRKDFSSVFNFSAFQSSAWSHSEKNASIWRELPYESATRNLAGHPRIVQLRRRHCSEIRLRNDAVGCRGHVGGGDHRRAAHHAVGESWRVSLVWETSSAPYECGHFRIRWECNLRSGLLLQSTPAQGEDVQ